MSTSRKTTREKREGKADRLRGWADGREAKAQAAAASTQAIADMIPMGQPVLIGHHSQRRHERDLDRINRGIRATVENSQKADEMRNRANNIEAAADRAIYDDDPDAIERLTEKIATLEAERERWKAYNASCRKAKREGREIGDTSLLDARQQANVLSLATIARLGDAGKAPGYVLTNLGGNIGRLRKRLEHLQQPEVGRKLTACRTDTCRACGAETSVGDTITYFKRSGEVECSGCSS